MLLVPFVDSKLAVLPCDYVLILVYFWRFFAEEFSPKRRSEFECCIVWVDLRVYDPFWFTDDLLLLFCLKFSLS